MQVSHTIQDSTDYDMFKPANHNRPVDLNSRAHKRMTAHMQTYGFLPMRPILVELDPTDERYIIHDGQRRFEAAKAAGAPIWYMVTDDPVWIWWHLELNDPCRGDMFLQWRDKQDGVAVDADRTDS